MGIEENLNYLQKFVSLINFFFQRPELKVDFREKKKCGDGLWEVKVWYYSI